MRVSTANNMDQVRAALLGTGDDDGQSHENGV